MGIQCNKIVFTKSISTQTEIIHQEQAITSKSSSNYMDNKLNDLIKNSFNNYTNRRPSNPTNTSQTNAADTSNKSRLFKFQTKTQTPSNKQISSDNITLKKINQNFQNSNMTLSASNKRVRISETSFEIDNLEENDFNNLNQDF